VVKASYSLDRGQCLEHWRKGGCKATFLKSHGPLHITNVLDQ
jgi:hypothetical protein